MPPEPETTTTEKPAPNTSKKATISLVLGITGLIAWFIPIFGLPVTITGLVYGIKGLDSTKKTQAIIGIVLCIIGLVLTIANAAIGAYLGVTGQHPTVNRVLDS